MSGSSICLICSRVNADLTHRSDASIDSDASTAFDRWFVGVHQEEEVNSAAEMWWKDCGTAEGSSDDRHCVRVDEWAPANI